MTKTRFFIYILLFSFCFSVTTAYSEPTSDNEKAWEIILDKWIDAGCAIGISKDIADPIKILSEKYNYYSNNSPLSSYCYKISFLLGECYYHGEGDTKNNAAAVYYYSRSAEKGYNNAKYMLAIMTLNKENTNTFIKISVSEAEKYLKEAADGGVKEAKEYMKAFKQNESDLIKSAEDGDKDSMKILAFLYAKGNEIVKVKRDKEKAKYWIKKYQHELDSNFEKEMVMLDFYATSESFELCSLQAKKILNNLPTYEISELKHEDLNVILSCACLFPLHTFEVSITPEKTSFKSDEDLDNYLKFIEPFFSKIENLDEKTNFSISDCNSFFVLADSKKDIWVKAVKKFNSLHSENVKIIEMLNNYFDKVGLKVGSELDLEDYQSIKKEIESIKSNIEQREPIIKQYLFDTPVTIASIMIIKVFSNNLLPQIDKFRLAKNFSIVSTSALPYTVLNDSRDGWFLACKIIKQNFSEFEYKELQNNTTKLIPALDLPKSYDMKWPD